MGPDHKPKTIEGDLRTIFSFETDFIPPSLREYISGEIEFSYQGTPSDVATFYKQEFKRTPTDATNTEEYNSVVYPIHACVFQIGNFDWTVLIGRRSTTHTNIDHAAHDYPHCYARSETYDMTIIKSSPDSVVTRFFPSVSNYIGLPTPAATFRFA